MSFTVTESDSTLKTATLGKKKSYCIIPQNTSRQVESTLNNNERIFSESTGLAKFSLSPSRDNRSSSPKRSGGGLPVYIPVSQTNDVQGVNSKNDIEFDDGTGTLLLQEYASKQRQLNELESKVEIIKNELLEISKKISNHTMKNISESNKNISDIPTPINNKNTNINTNTNTLNILKNKASNIFNIQTEKERPVNSNDTKSLNFQGYLNKFQTQINGTTANIIPKDTLKNIVNDVGRNIDENNDKFKKFLVSNNSQIDQLSHKTSKLFNGIITNLSPTKAKSDQEIINSSFNFDNLTMNEINHSLILEEEDEDTNSICDTIHIHDMSHSSNIVDIDEYDSEVDTEQDF
ncbi:hypothetical protein CAAN1_02S00606 [[Candida] anglica]|uniref:Topoisomerase I damage affected protein 11 n=1 Tax=[Candida] anglica TaxID=148631 RepID=A0ABP0E6K8_9ASCO